MAYDQTYSFDTLAGNSGDFIWDGPDVDVLSARDTDGAWCWTSTGSVSSSTGPPTGTACVYTETSSPVAAADVFIMTLAVANEVDASLYALYVTFNNCMYGNTAGHQYFEAWNGTSWQAIDDWAGNTTTTFTSRGPYDFTAYTNSDFSIRIRNVVGGTAYQNDFAVDQVRIYGADKIVDPVITNCGDEDHYIGENGVVITGTDFGTDGANSRVRINSASNGAGTDQVQTDTSWTDTIINFTTSLGSLSYGANYLFVRNQSLDENPVGYAINLYQNILTTSLNDTTFYDGQTGIEINGSGFNATQGISKVYLCDSSDGSGVNVEQIVTAWSATKVTFTVVREALSLGTAYVIVARNQSSLGDSAERFSPSQTATLEAAPAIPTITSIDGDNVIIFGQSADIIGSNFGALQGTGRVDFCASGTYGSPVAQGISSWANGVITISSVQGSLIAGINYLFIENDAGLRNATGFVFTASEPASSDGLYIESSIQTTITSSGLNTTAFLIRDEG